MHSSLSIMALAPFAVQAAQSTQWPAFVLRANVTQQYNSAIPEDTRSLWHNAPLSTLGTDGNDSPVFSDECAYSQAIAFSDHAPYTQPDLFYLNATSTAPYAPSRLLFGSFNVKIASKTQTDSQGRRPLAVDTCGEGSSSLYISTDEPYHLVYEDREAPDDQFGSFYACGTSSLYGDAIYYRSAAEQTPESCGDVTFYPECMPLSYTIHTTQGNSTIDVDHSAAGAYKATCYVNTKDVLGEPYAEINTWFSAPRTEYYPIGHVSVPQEQPASY